MYWQEKIFFSILSFCLNVIHSQVHIVGRRGPVHAAFTTKEFREMLNLPNVKTYLPFPSKTIYSIDHINIFSWSLYVATRSIGSSRTRTPKTTSFRSNFSIITLDSTCFPNLHLLQQLKPIPEGAQQGEKRVFLHFYRRPDSFLEDPNKRGELAGVKLEVSHLVHNKDGVHTVYSTSHNRYPLLNGIL